MQNNLGSRIKFMCEKKGLSQTGLAKLAKVSQGAISQLENGTAEATKHIGAIAKALGVTSEYLTDGKELIKFKSECINGIARSTDNNDGQVLPVDTTDVTPKSSKNLFDWY